MRARPLSHEERKRVIYALEFTDREHSLQTPEEVHQYAWHYNWDDGDEAMRRLIDHPAIDKGTALLIYWHANPYFFSQYVTRNDVPEWARSDYDLIKEIELRFTNNVYTRATLHYDPTNDQGLDLTQEQAAQASEPSLPAIMLQATSGRHVAWDELYDDLSDKELEQLEIDIGQEKDE